MPPVKWFSRRNQHISASGWQPGQIAHSLWGQFHAIGDAGRAIVVITASTRGTVEEITSNRRPNDRVVLLINHLVEATATTAIAKRFPFFRRHVFERFFDPKGSAHSASLCL